MRAFHEGLSLADPRIMDYEREFASPWSVTMQTIWPNMIVQRELNTLGTRQIVPMGPNEFAMIWTMFGYEGDSEAMVRHRLRQGNLMGPAGLLGLEDNEAMKFVQDGIRKSTGGAAVIELGGTITHHHAVGREHRPWYDRQRPELFAAAILLLTPLAFLLSTARNCRQLADVLKDFQEVHLEEFGVVLESGGL